MTASDPVSVSTSGVNDPVLVPVLRVDSSVPLPVKGREGDAAFDLCAAVDVTLAPGSRALVPTGVAVALPVNWCALVLSRSGLALRDGLCVLNAPGLIDSGYRGEVQVILFNAGDETKVVRANQRIAQLLVQPAPAVALVPVSDLPASHDGRGDQGFGSSGK